MALYLSRATSDTVVCEQVLPMCFRTASGVLGVLQGAGYPVMDRTRPGSALSIFLPRMFSHSGFQRAGPGPAASGTSLPRGLMGSANLGLHLSPVNSDTMGLGPGSPLSQALQAILVHTQVGGPPLLCNEENAASSLHPVRGGASQGGCPSKSVLKCPEEKRMLFRIHVQPLCHGCTCHLKMSPLLVPLLWSPWNPSHAQPWGSAWLTKSHCLHGPALKAACPGHMPLYVSTPGADSLPQK